MAFVLEKIETSAAWEEFLEFPWKIYKGDSVWAPPLRIAIKDLLDEKKNPFFQHAKMLPLLARNEEDGSIVGRVVGVIDDNHNDFHKEKTAFFGYLELIDNQAVLNLLLNEVARWAKANGMETLRGPVNLSTNNEVGLLVEGFDDPPMVMMTYNPPYYAKLLEGWGLRKSKDLLAYDVAGTNKFSERLERHVGRLRSRDYIKFRTVNMKNFTQEVEKILDIYNDAWEENWGFVPMTPAEIRHMAKELKPVVDPNLIFFIEVRGEPVGFALALPDINQAIATVPKGKLLPTGIFKLLWNLKGPGRKKTINRCRILTLGIKRSHARLGLGPLFYFEFKERVPPMGYPGAEASWILEDNVPMNDALLEMGAVKTKRYRVYDRDLRQ